MLLVKNQKAFQDLQIMLVGYLTTDSIVQFFVCEGLEGLETLVGKRWP